VSRRLPALPRPSHLLALGLALASAALAGACSSDAKPLREFHFDRPNDIAFGCVRRVTDDAGVESTVAVPLSECANLREDLPDGGMALNQSLVGFATQPSRGDLVVAQLVRPDSNDPTRSVTAGNVVGDSDPLTPGHNGLTLGTEPVSADTTPDGCFLVVANAGSCDLSQVNVLRAARTVNVGQVFAGKATTRSLVKTKSGVPLAASPTLVVTPLPGDRVVCPESAGGIAYVAYPSCHMVAEVDLATGQIQSSVSFSKGAAPTLDLTGEVTCPIECTEITGATGGTPVGDAEPATMVMDPAGGRLYVGVRGDLGLFVVDVDTVSGLFTGTPVRVALEDAGGPAGVLRLAASHDIAMGAGGGSGTHRFVYAIAADRSIRVIEVTPTLVGGPVECDTQVDAGQLRKFTDVSRLPCFPVGKHPDLRRRVNARGPGVRLPGDAVPYDVAFFDGRHPKEEKPPLMEPSPFRLNGTFAAVTSKNALFNGVAFYINVNDDNYEDFLSPTDDPTQIEMALALPHQLRDAVTERRHPTKDICTEDTTLTDRVKGPVRTLASSMTFDSKQAYNFNVVIKKDGWPGDGTVVPGRIAPLIHLEVCPAATDRTVFQSTGVAPSSVRAKVFPDLASVITETWRVGWEGPLAFTDFLQLHQGGVVSPVPGQLELTLEDQSGPFCDLGAEERDIVRLLGCLNDTGCALDETCYFDPETPANLPGMCLPRGHIDELAGQCKPLLISQRKYLIKASGGGAGTVEATRLTLVPKPTVLTTTPLGGCSSNKQCELLYKDEQKLSGVPADKTYTCQATPERGGPDACVAVCPNNQDAECPTGSVCQDLRCVEGAFVPAACYGPLQLYDVRAGNAYTVVGSVSGYVHDRVVGANGVCESTHEPLRVGRFHPNEPICDPLDDGDPNAVNPCSVELSEPIGLVEGTTQTIGHRKSFGIRFRNLAFRIDFSDVFSLHPQPTQIDPAHPAPSDPLTKDVLEVSLPLGFTFVFEIGAGLIPRADGLISAPNPPSLLPARTRVGPDGAVWVLDSGDSNTSAGVRRGEIIRLTSQGSTEVAN